MGMTELIELTAEQKLLRDEVRRFVREVWRPASIERNGRLRSGHCASGSARCIPRQAVGKLGQRDLNQGEIFFDNVRLPKAFMVCSDPIT